MKTYKIKDFVDIITGITIVNSGAETCRVIPIRGIDKNGINYSCVESVFATTRSKPIQSGDVLLANRGRFCVALVEDDLPYKDISTPSFVFTLRIFMQDLILPEYLYYYLNMSKVQNKLFSFQQGGNIQFVSKAEFMNFDITIPALDKQHRIAQLYKNILKSQRIMERKIYLLSKFSNNVTNQLGEHNEQ